MLIALLSDVHGNLAALDAVRRDIRTNVPGEYTDREVELVWFLGDLIGRGPQPLECIAAFQRWEQELSIRYLAGNHEALYWRVTQEEFSNRVANEAMDVHRPLVLREEEWLRERFTDPHPASYDSENTHRFWADSDHTEWRVLRLRDSLQHEDVSLAVCHGTWFYPEAFEYLYPHGWKPEKESTNLERVRRHTRELAADNGLDGVSVLVAGHSHLPMGFYIADPTARELYTHNLPPNERVTLHKGIYIFNAGSVGHSRFGPPFVTRYLLLDTRDHTIQLRALPYRVNMQRLLVNTYGMNTFLYEELMDYFHNPPFPLDYRYSISRECVTLLEDKEL